MPAAQIKAADWYLASVWGKHPSEHSRSMTSMQLRCLEPRDTYSANNWTEVTGGMHLSIQKAPLESNLKFNPLMIDSKIVAPELGNT